MSGPGVVGYRTTTSGWGATWHADPACSHLTGAHTRPAIPVTGTTYATLAAEQSKIGGDPCRRCAYRAVLDSLADAIVGPGAHYLMCGATHGGPTRCVHCTSLAAYGNARDVLTTTTSGGRVALLLPGAVGTPERSDLTLTRMRLAGHSAHGETTQALTLASWAVAADLIARRTVLSEALAVAGALHTAPTRT